MSTDALIREATPADDDAVAELITAYLTWAHGVLESDYGIDEPPSDVTSVRATLADLGRPAAATLLVERAGRPVGVGAIRGLGTEVAEIKRMYVDPAARGDHLGARILDRLIDIAREAGASVVRLDTCEFMTAAQRLYRSREFIERDAYEGTEIPERLRRYWLFFERRL